MCCCSGETRDRLREARDSRERYRSGVDQLTSERVKLRSLRAFAEHDEALNHESEHRPRTEAVRLAASRQKSALLVKDCERAVAITCVSHLSKKGSLAGSLYRVPWLGGTRGLGVQECVCPVSAEEIYQT